MVSATAVPTNPTVASAAPKRPAIRTWARRRRGLRPDIFAVHVHDACDVLREFRRRVTAGEGHVPGIVQQPDFGVRDLHQPVHIARRLDVRAHMMMIGEANAARQRVTRECRHAIAVRRPFGIRTKPGAARKWHGSALDRVGDFAINHHLRAVAR